MSDPFGGFDPRMFEQVPFFRELAKVMSWSGGPVNWDLARQTAEALAGRDPRALGDGGTSEEAFSDAVDTAELWLDQVTGLPRVAGPARSLDAGAWAELATTAEGLGRYVEPIARGMGETLSGQLPEELQQQLGSASGMKPALDALGAMLFGVQVGTVAGNLADQLVGTYDLGVPTTDPRVVGTVGGGLGRFATDFDLDESEARYWLALREAAHRRVFGGLPWLREHLDDLISRFASEADLDPSRMMDALGGAGFDPSDPEALEQALQDPDAFEIEPTEAQKRILRELQTLVAFTEGWSATIVHAAAADRLPSLGRIEEAALRHRAEHGPGERFLQQLMGLDLKPADLRQGRDFCDAVVAARDLEGLDRAWARAEHLPRPDELEDPSRWLVRMAAIELGVDGDPPEQH
ncbi:zinc-dependent metalloprotease [Egibacter rhizosphaerae]|nr:zinc-dependent metalloprotease [Egibacter rhizosphaerae]